MKTKMAFLRTPIKLKPAAVDRVWGGGASEKRFGWPAPAGRTIGEWWVLSFRHDHPSIIEDGIFHRIPLPQLIYAHPELLGKDVEPALLIKILDSADRLSVQVHPDDGLARELGLDSGKTECWLYLESAPKARVYIGPAKGMTPKAFFKAASGNPRPKEMEAMLRAVPVREGDLSFIPAGTIHAIGKGVLLLEVQQNSDTTFRIYDWGRPREVHLKQAQRAVEAAAQRAETSTAPDENILVSCGKFVLRRIKGSKMCAFPETGPVYAAITCLNGSGLVRSHDYEKGFKPGDTWFLPAHCQEVAFESEKEALWIHSQQPQGSV
ncbi:MAG: hypothetical protein KJ645_08400 [Planctomycetes bacterium]|nr:hypothetical protein [Planctomycetota bacterium]